MSDDRHVIVEAEPEDEPQAREGADGDDHAPKADVWPAQERCEYAFRGTRDARKKLRR